MVNVGKGAVIQVPATGQSTYDPGLTCRWTVTADHGSVCTFNKFNALSLGSKAQISNIAKKTDP